MTNRTHFTQKTYKAVSVSEMNKALNYCKKFRNILLEKPSKPIKYLAFLEIKDVNIELTYKNEKGQNITLITRLDGEKAKTRGGLEAFKILSQYYKVPRPAEKSDYSASAFLYFNEEKSGKRYENCYGYDINSSYTWAMIQDMPDTSKAPDLFRKLEKNEIGFDSNYNIIKKGFAFLIYPKMESPFKEFARVWYEKKKNAPKGSDEKQRAKDVLNFSVGYLQRVNPILRTAILSYANQRIMSYVDENTLYCNTDSIISTVRRPDIEKDLGNELGQWKLEHYGSFAYKGFAYQWDYDIPTYRGIPKSRFKKGWDVLNDSIPEKNYMYKYDYELNKIVKVK